MKVLVIGGTKFIGREITQQCLDRSYEVVLFNRGETEHSFDIETIRGDVDQLIDFKSQLLAVKADVVIHCIAYTETHAQDLVEVFKDTNTRLLILGSQDCYEAFQQLNRGKEVSDFPITEESALCSIKYYWRDQLVSKMYDYDKNLMTDVLLKAHSQQQVRATVFRLPMVYGPYDSQFYYRHGYILRRIYDRQKTLLLGSIDQSMIFTYGYIENVAAAIVHAIDHPQTGGHVYNIGESQVRTRRRWAELYAKAAGWEFDIQVVPDSLITGTFDHLNAPPRNMIADCSKYSVETGFKNPVSLDQSIAQTLEFALETPEALGDKPDYAKEMAIFQKYDDFIRAHLQ